MDFSDANTEASLRLHRSHERRNISLKMQVIGLGLLADEIDKGISADTIKEKLYARPGWLWGGMPDWTGPRTEVYAAINDIGQNGVARAFSAFDLFLDDTESEINSWCDFSGESVFTSSENTSGSEVDRVDRFYTRLATSHARVAHLWPVYRYFRFARDCIVHRETMASPALYEAQTAPDLEPTLKRWIEKTGELTVPDIVDVRIDAPILFTHRQALAASSILRLIAFDITRVAIERMTAKGFVYLAVRRAFLAERVLPEIANMATMVNAFNWMLSNRYRVREYNSVEAQAILRDIGLTRKCSAAFKKIKQRSPT